MASKSRLGKGLGALFPTLPGEEKAPLAQPKKAAAPIMPAAKPAANKASAAAPKKAAKPKSAATKRSQKVAAPASAPEVADITEVTEVTEVAAAAPATPAAAPAVEPVREVATSAVDVAEAAENVPVSPLDSTIPSMGVMTRNAETVSRLSQPMTLQPEAAEHHLNAVESPAPKKNGKRAVMVSIEEMGSHPSDMFFDPTDVLPLSAPKTAATAANSQDADADLQNELKPVEGGYLVELKIDDIGPNLHQPRMVFDEKELQELADSILEVGILQPIVVRKRPQEQIDAAHAAQAANGADNTSTDGDFTGRMDSPYEIIMGERRWRASHLAGLETVPAIVKTTPDDVMLRDALLENLHRVALNPLEEAAAYQQMIDEFGLTQMELAKSVSKSRPQIANTLRLMNLPASVQNKVSQGLLSAGHARALLGLPSKEDMEQLAERIISEGLSVRSTEEIVSMRAAQSDQPKKPRVQHNNPWAGSDVQQHLEQRFDTKVSIKGSENHGRIEIVFSSPEDMNRILTLLMQEQEAAAAQAL